MNNKYNVDNLLPQSEIILVNLLYQILDMLLDKNQYRYIAFSTLSYYDYKLFSNIVDSNNMIVVKDEQSSIDRIRFNFPYDQNSIFDDSFENVLSDLPSNKDVIRLNYHTELSQTIMNDIQYMMDKIKMGSIFMLSINVNTPKFHLCGEEKFDFDKKQERKKEALEELPTLILESIDIDKELDPYGEEDCILFKWNYSKQCKKLIDDKIHRCLSSRNAKEQTGIQYLQLFNYNTVIPNGTKILTIGGIVYDQNTLTIIEQIDLDNILLNISDETKKIEIPVLTDKEIMLVNDILPNTIPSEKKEILIECTSKNLKEIALLYSYFD